jgi:synaptic vesicle membrane protein VAT-1
VRRVRIDRPGGYDALQVVQAPDPKPGPGQVLVDVEAAGVNFADCVVRMGLYASAKEYVGWPITPGLRNRPGDVRAVGAGVDPAAWAGRDVVAVTRFGMARRRTWWCLLDQVFERPAELSA